MLESLLHFRPRHDTQIAIFLVVFFMVINAVFYSTPVVLANFEYPSQTTFDTNVVFDPSDTNIAWYIGTSTSAGTIVSTTLYLNNATSSGDVSVRLTCFNNTWSGDSTGCTVEEGVFSDTVVTSLNNPQEYTFTWAEPYIVQLGKVYVMEIISEIAKASEVYGKDTLNFTEQCTFFGGSQDCTGTPFYVFESSFGGITSVISPTSTTYATNPITFSGLYSNEGGFDRIDVELQAETQGAPVVLLEPIPQVTGSDIFFSFDRNLTFQGEYSGRIRLIDTTSASTSFWTILPNFVLGTSSVATTSVLFSTPVALTCSTFDLGCYIKQAFVWLFYPEVEAIDQFKTLSIQDKFPFAYAYDMGNIREELFNASTTAITTVSVPFGTFGSVTLMSEGLLMGIPFREFLRNMLSYLLWFMFAMLIYKQVLTAHNKETVV